MEIRSIEILGYTLSALAIAFTVVSWAFIWYFREKRIVAMSQPRLLSIVCFGSLVAATGMLFWSAIAFPSSNPWVNNFTVYCRLSTWFLNMGTAIIQTALVCKLYRVHKVTKFRRGQKVLAHQVLWPFFLVLSVVIPMNIAMDILYPPDHEVYGGLYGACYAPDSPGMKMHVIGQSAINILLQIAIFVFAWKLRNFNEEIGESKRIFHLSCFHLGNCALFWAIYILVLQVNVFGIDETTIVDVGEISMQVTWFLYEVSSVGFLVLPRMHYVWYEYKHGHLPEHLEVFGGGRIHVSISIKNETAIRTENENDGRKGEPTRNESSV